MLVSVVVATYNRADIISRTLHSILSQTHSNLELIIVSDGSPDNVKDVAQSIGDHRIRYYEIAHSGRPAVPRNFGIKKARGEYVAFCDDDDTWMPEKLRFQMDNMLQDKELGLVYTQCLSQRGDKFAAIPRNGKEGYIFKELFLSSNFIANSTVLTKKDVINAVGVFDEDMRLKAAEDYDLWLRIAMRYKVGFITKPLVVHREVGHSLTRMTQVKLRIQYSVPWKFYRKKYVGLILFINKLLRIFYMSLLIIFRQNKVSYLAKGRDK